MKKITLEQLNQSSATEFEATLATIYEHSPWVAAAVSSQRPFLSLMQLHEAMVAQVKHASEQKQLKLIRAHPELAGKAAVSGQLTVESTNEQSGAGLDQCSEVEFEQLTEFNRRYQDKFHFPFILAVKGHNRRSIIEQFSKRLENTIEQERQTNLEQIYKIAQFRLEHLIS